jgi:hypothetical protein
MPTILDLVGLDPLPGAEGRSLVPEIVSAARGEDSNPDDLGDRAVYSQLDKTWGRSQGESAENPDRNIAMVKGPYRMIYRERTPKRVELFDHSEDPIERLNVFLREPEFTQGLVDELEAFLEKPNTVWGETPEVELDEMRLHQLRALGYFVGGPDGPGMKPLAEKLQDDQEKRKSEHPLRPEVREDVRDLRE